MLLSNQFKPVSAPQQAVGIDSDSEYKWSEEEAYPPPKPPQLLVKPQSKKKEIVVIKRPVIQILPPIIPRGIK